MKKFASILLTAALLAAMLSVFAVPASAEETKTAEEYLSEAERYEKEENHKDAGEAFAAAADQYYYKEVDYVSAAEAYRKAGECFEKEEDFGAAASNFRNAGLAYNLARNYASFAGALIKAGECFEKDKDFRQGGHCFVEAASAAQAKANELLDRTTGSTLSEGSLTIICTVAAAAIFGLGGFILGTKKKKKPALAGGENTDEE